MTVISKKPIVSVCSDFRVTPERGREIGAPLSALISKPLSYGPELTDEQKRFHSVFSRHYIFRPSQKRILYTEEPVYIYTDLGLCFDLDFNVISETCYRDLPVNQIEWGRDELKRAVQNGSVDEGDGVYFPICSQWSRVYYHLITESLPAVEVGLALARQEGFNILLPFRAGPRQSFLESLSGSNCVLPRYRIFKGKAALYSGLFTHSDYGSELLAAVDRLRDRIGVPYGVGGRSIYAARGAGATRKVENEPELVEFLSSQGWDIVNNDQLSFKEQVALYSNASNLIGLHGANLTNLLWMVPGSKILEVRGLNRLGANPSWNTSYRRLSALGGKIYSYFLCENGPDENGFLVDMNAFKEFYRRYNMQYPNV